MDGRENDPVMLPTDFVQRSPLTRAALEMLAELIPGHDLVDQLRIELEAVGALPATGLG